MLNDAGWLQTRLWIYALYALTIYVRVAAERRQCDVPMIAREIAAAAGIALDR